MLQIDFVLDLFEKAKQSQIHTVVDTSGEPFTRQGAFFETFTRLLACTDLFLLDIKHINREAHRRLTGKPNTAIWRVRGRKTMWVSWHQRRCGLPHAAAALY